MVYLCFSMVCVSSSFGNHLAKREREREREREGERNRELKMCSCYHVIVCVSSLWCHGLVCGLCIQNTQAFNIWVLFFLGTLYLELTLKAPFTTKVVSFIHLLICLRSLFDKQCRLEQSYLGPRCLL